MKPILFEVFGIPFASWYVFFALAGLSAYAYAWALFSCLRGGIREKILDNFPLLFAVGYIFGWIGARLLSIFVDEVHIAGFTDTLLALFRVGPMTFYGGAVLAAIAGFVIGRWKNLPMGTVCDGFFPAGILALGVGRVGCFLNGDDFGKPLPQELGNPWWATLTQNFGDGVPRYPAQLQEAIVCFIIAAGVGYVFRFRQNFIIRYPGFIASITVLFSALNRFFNEFFRGDPRGVFPGTALTTSQGIAVILFCLCMFLCYWIFTKNTASQLEG